MYQLKGTVNGQSKSKQVSGKYEKQGKVWQSLVNAIIKAKSGSPWYVRETRQSPAVCGKYKKQGKVWQSLGSTRNKAKSGRSLVCMRNKAKSGSLW